MTDKQWHELLSVISGETSSIRPIGFIIDSPWLPKWYGVTILDYFSSNEVWLKANLKVIETFPEVTFLPGFWSEFGMCTEPSAYGAKSIFWKNEFPFAEKLIHSVEEIDNLPVPNPETDGLLPFMLNRLVQTRPDIERSGHKIRFSVSRGPLNIASFLMGTTEFLTALMVSPDKVHKLLRNITDFLLRWHALQRKEIPTIDGILLLDDIVGFLGEAEFLEFGYPYLRELYEQDVRVKFFHNDSDCAMSVKYYPELGINLYNPGLDLSLNEIKELTGNRMTVLGTIPPRDVLAAGTPEKVAESVKKLIETADTTSRLILSCGGGMPPDVSTENIRAFIGACR